MSQTVRGRWCGRVVCAGVARMRMMLCDFGGPHTENETLPVQGVRASVGASGPSSSARLRQHLLLNFPRRAGNKRDSYINGLAYKPERLLSWVMNRKHGHRKRGLCGV